jgi:hypothetical protein
MGAVREAVDDRDQGVPCELFDVLLGEGPNHDRVEVAGKNGRRVLERLASAKLEVAGREVEAGPSELRDPDLEGDARPRGGLLEDHPQRPAGEQVVLLAPFLLLLELVREVERALELLAGPVRHAREVASLQAVERRHHAGRCYFFR